MRYGVAESNLVPNQNYKHRLDIKWFCLFAWANILAWIKIEREVNFRTDILLEQQKDWGLWKDTKGNWKQAGSCTKPWQAHSNTRWHCYLSTYLGPRPLHCCGSRPHWASEPSHRSDHYRSQRRKGRQGPDHNEMKMIITTKQTNRKPTEQKATN